MAKGKKARRSGQCAVRRNVKRCLTKRGKFVKCGSARAKRSIRFSACVKKHSARRPRKARRSR